MAAEIGQTAAKLGLKNYDELQQRRDEGESQKNNRQPGQHFGAARAAKVKIAVVNSDTEQSYFDDAAPAFEPELEKFLRHDSSASAARNAATFSLTSCTRNTSAPHPRKIAVSAMVGARRSLISEGPINFSRKDLRETPTTSGRLCTRSRLRFLSSAKLCSSVLPN